MNYKIFQRTCTEVHKTFLKASEITINTEAVQPKFQHPRPAPLKIIQLLLYNFLNSFQKFSDWRFLPI